MAISPYILSIPFEISIFLFNDLVKTIYIQEGLDGDSSIIDVGSLIYCDKKINCVYYGTALKLSLHIHTGQLL